MRFFFFQGCQHFAAQMAANSNLALILGHLYKLKHIIAERGGLQVIPSISRMEGNLNSKYTTNVTKSVVIQLAQTTFFKVPQSTKFTTLKYWNICRTQKGITVEKWQLVFSSRERSSSLSTQNSWVFGQTLNHCCFPPPYSPNLAPCDFFLLSKLKNPSKKKFWDDFGD